MEEGCGGDIVTEAVTGEDVEVHDNEGETLEAVAAADEDEEGRPDG